MASPNLVVPVACTKLGAWVMELLQRSQFPIPKLRKAALRESFREARSEEELKDIFLDTICGSPYLETSVKEKLVNTVMRGDWKLLMTLTGVHENFTTQYSTTYQRKLSEFKYMASRIFIKSRVMRRLPIKRRQHLGKALLACQSKEAVLELILLSLEKSLLFNRSARQRIVNDFLEGRYYNLLLSDRFDCDILPRLDFVQKDEEPEECAVCLDELSHLHCYTLPLCGHIFCKPCIEDVARTHNGHPFPCPLCRTEYTLDDTMSVQSQDID